MLALSAGCSSRVMSAGPAQIDCSTLAPAQVVAALEGVRSYTYHAEGTLAYAGPGSTDPTPLHVIGSYRAPDRLSEVYAGHTFDLEEMRIVGTSQWIRPHGSLRWVALASSAELVANDLLADVRHMTDWQPPAAADTPGYCNLAGSGRFTEGGRTVDGSLVVTTPPGSAMPASVAVDLRFDPVAPNPLAVARKQVTYAVEAGTDVTIDAPVVDKSSATDDDLRYALRHLGCATPPCNIGDLEVVYSVHQPGLDMFGYTLGGLTGQAWFDDGRPTEVVPVACDAPAFAWHEHLSGSSAWIGGPMTVVEAATLRVVWSDGASEDHEVTNPAYIVPARGGSGDDPQVVEVTLLGPDGAVLLRSEEPSPGC